MGEIQCHHSPKRRQAIPREDGVDVSMILVWDLICCLGLPKENCCRVGVGAKG